MMRFIFFISCFFIISGSDLAWAQEPGKELSVKPSQFSIVYGKYTEAFQNENYSQALKYAEEAYALGKEKFDPASETVANLALNLGIVTRKLYKSKKAKPYLKEAFKILKNIYGKEHIKLLDVYMELAANYAQQRNFGLSETFFKNVKRVVKQEYGEQSPFLFSLTLEMADLVYSYERTLALQYYEDAFELGKTVYPEGNYLIGYASFSTAKIYMGGGASHRRKAEKYFIETLKIFEETPPPSIDSVLITHGLLTQLYSEMGYDDKATLHCIAVGRIRGDYDLNEYQALYKKSPKFPISEFDRKGPGVVLVEYVVDSEGRVINPVILESTSSAFSKKALGVVTEWRYAPRVIDEIPVDTSGVRTRIIFEIAE